MKVGRYQRIALFAAILALAATGLGAAARAASFSEQVLFIEFCSLSNAAAGALATAGRT
jgi:hypothetical protein